MPDPCGCQLDGQRQAVQVAAERGHYGCRLRGHGKRRMRVDCAVLEEPDRFETKQLTRVGDVWLGQPERWYRPENLAADCQRFAAGGKYVQLRAGGQQRPTSLATAATRCSQLSKIKSARRARRLQDDRLVASCSPVRRLWLSRADLGSRMASAELRPEITSASAPSAPNSTSQTPSGKSSRTVRPSSTASRVLPTPGGPVESHQPVFPHHSAYLGEADLDAR